MDKRGRWWIWVSIILVVLLVGVIFVYFALFNPNNERIYAGKDVENPVTNLTDEQAVLLFDEKFVFYLLYNLKAYNLHNPPLSSDTPKIEVKTEDKIYNAEIKNGMIEISKGEVADGDIAIITTKEEVVKMMREQKYIMQSFTDGKSEIELIASSTTLFAKGYLNFYNEIKGKSVTGNILRIYSS